MDAGQVVKRLSRRVIAVDRSMLDLGTGLRCGTGIALPLAIGLAAGHPGGGAYVAVGSLLTGLATFQPGYRHRVATMLAVAVSLAAVAFVAGVVGTWTWVVVVLAGCLAVAAGLLGAVGPGVAQVSTLGTIVFLIVSSEPVPIMTAMVHAAQIGVGGLLQALVVLSPWPRRAVAPERRALAAAYRNLASYATSLPEGRIALPDPKVIEELRASLARASRRVRWGPGRTLQSLTDEAVRVRTSLQALAFARQQLTGLMTPESAATYQAQGARAASDAERARLDQALASLDVVARSTGLLLDAVATSIIDGRPPPPAADLHDAMAHAALTLERSRAWSRRAPPPHGTVGPCHTHWSASRPGPVPRPMPSCSEPTSPSIPRHAATPCGWRRLSSWRPSCIGLCLAPTSTGSPSPLSWS